MKNVKILVPVDGSPLTRQTVERLIDFREHINLPLTLLNVLDLDSISYHGFGSTDYREIEERARRDARQLAADCQARFADAGVPAEILVREGAVRETIIEVADSGDYDLLVIGKHTESPLRKLMFGQISHHVMHHTKCPVLIV